MAISGDVAFSGYPHTLSASAMAQVSDCGDRPRCDKKAGFHLIDPEQVHAGNLAFLSEYVTEGGMIAKRHQSRLCARCQRRLRKAVKRARSLGLIPTDASFDAENTLGFPDDVHKCHVSRTM